MQPEIEKIKKRLTRKAEKNRVPYYHELAKFKIKIEKGFEKLKVKYKKLQEEDEAYEFLIDEYRNTKI
jgi:hypothetical protein